MKRASCDHGVMGYCQKCQEERAPRLAHAPAPHPPEEPSAAPGPASDWDRVHDLAAQAADELMRHDARGLVVMIRDIAAQHLPEPAPADPEAGAPGTQTPNQGEKV